jgi:hypothetical protein
MVPCRGSLFDLIRGGARPAATYVSPILYENLSCRQIAEEAARVSRRAAEVAGVQDSQATKDSVVTGVAIVVFWPAAFFVGGDRQSAAELGRLKGDPVKQGLVSSLNWPGGNATGITVFTTSLTAKRLDIFRELVPKAKVFGVLVNPTTAQAPEQIQDAEESARSLGFEIRVLNARSDAEFEPALTALAGVRDAALLVSADPLFIARRETLVAEQVSPPLENAHLAQEC